MYSKMWRERVLTIYVYTASWSDIADRRKFFETYAREVGFDPYNPDNWYLVQIKSMKVFFFFFFFVVVSMANSIQGAKTIAKYHDNSISGALIDLFPDIQFDKSKFSDQSWTALPSFLASFFLFLLS
jgi:hypothetical protein